MCAVDSGEVSDIHRNSTSEFGDRELVYANCRIEDLPCYHEGLTRNTAEILLLSAEEGSYLIRPSTTTPGNFSLSVRLTNSVRHFQITNDGQWFTFGQAQFWTPLELWIHLQKSPVLECEEGVAAHLMSPFLHEKKTQATLPPTEYCRVTRQYEQSSSSLSARSLSGNVVLSKEGPLYKKKDGKSWKRRWFILNKHCLSFKKHGNEKKIRKSLDLRYAIHVHEDHHSSKKNCFRIVFPAVSYILSADSPEERDAWFSLITWQIENAYRRTSV